MTAPTLEELQQDRLAMTVARATALANGAARSHGTDPAGSLITVTEEGSPAGPLWRIHYGPRDFVHQRGGDLIVVVDERAGVVERVIHGQ